MQRLVALDLAGGPRFVEMVRRCWDDGDAVFVVDQRLDVAARDALLAQVRPHVVVGATPTDDRVGPDPAPPLADGDALLVATSGATGVPKLLVHTLGSLRAHAQAVHARLAVDPDRDHWLACLPLNHLGGFGVVARSLLTGTAVEVLASFDAALVAQAPRVHGATLTSLVPTALDRIDPAVFRIVVLGGAADPVERPTNVLRTYGLTETGGGVVYDGTAADTFNQNTDPRMRYYRWTSPATGGLVNIQGWGDWSGPSTVPTAMATSARPLTIGGGYGSFWPDLDADVYSVAIWDVALPPAEAAALNSGAAVVDPRNIATPPALYMPFEAESPGDTTVADLMNGVVGVLEPSYTFVDGGLGTPIDGSIPQVVAMGACP